MYPNDMVAAVASSPALPDVPTQLESALAKAEAAAAVLEDRRCRPAEAQLLLQLGWSRLAAALGHAGPEALARLADAPPASLAAADRPRLKALLPALAPAGPEADPAPAKPEDLAFLAERLAGVARAELFKAAPGRAAQARRRQLAQAGAALAALAVLAVVAVPRSKGPPPTGWRAIYYPKEDLTGTPVPKREANLNFFWDEAGGASGLPGDHWSARYDGCLQVAKDGTATFALGADDGARLYIDGKKVIENWGPHSMTWKDQTLAVSKGVHALKVEFREGVGTASVMLKLGWDGAPPLPLDPFAVLYPGETLDEKDPCAQWK